MRLYQLHIGFTCAGGPPNARSGSSTSRPRSYHRHSRTFTSHRLSTQPVSGFAAWRAWRERNMGLVATCPCVAAPVNGLNARCCVPAAAATLSMRGSYHSTSAAVMNSFAASMALRRTRTASPTCSGSVGPKTEKHNASLATRHMLHTRCQSHDTVTRHANQPCGPVQRARARRPRLHATRVSHTSRCAAGQSGRAAPSEVSTMSLLPALKPTT